jgi:hypothetical protein
MWCPSGQPLRAHALFYNPADANKYYKHQLAIAIEGNPNKTFRYVYPDTSLYYKAVCEQP